MTSLFPGGEILTVGFHLCKLDISLLLLTKGGESSQFDFTFASWIFPFFFFLTKGGNPHSLILLLQAGYFSSSFF